MARPAVQRVRTALQRRRMPANDLRAALPVAPPAPLECNAWPSRRRTRSARPTRRTLLKCNVHVRQPSIAIRKLARVLLLRGSLTCSPHLMLRRLLVALVFILPLQFVWAAVAPYCGHESEPASFHFGHHAQAPDSEARDKVSSSKKLQSGSAMGLDQPDCGQCHASLAQFASGLPGSVEVPACSFLRPVPSSSFCSWVDQDIERPKWSRAS